MESSPESARNTKDQKLLLDVAPPPPSSFLSAPRGTGPTFALWREKPASPPARADYWEGKGGDTGYKIQDTACRLLRIFQLQPPDPLLLLPERTLHAPAPGYCLFDTSTARLLATSPSSTPPPSLLLPPPTPSCPAPSP